MIHVIFGPQGAGKSTYALQLRQAHGAIYFSIDDWMHRLYGADLTGQISMAWIMERVGRCEALIYELTNQLSDLSVPVILDLGLQRKTDRKRLLDFALQNRLKVQLHFITAPYECRKERVMRRNHEEGATFRFTVTATMFDAMESLFEYPDEPELNNVIVKDTTQG